MEFNSFTGIDVSKEKLDYQVLVDGKKVFHHVSDNNKKGIKSLLSKLKKHDIDIQSCLFCMEHTGIYSMLFLEYAIENKLHIWLEHASNIKAFHGLVRDKNDEIDALRIAEYAYAKRGSAELWDPPREIITQLKSLISARQRLVDTKKRLNTPLEEEAGYVNSAWHKEHKKLINPVLNQVSQQLKKIEKRILELIKSDLNVMHLYELVSSVKGVGLVVATNFIVVTNEFKLINDPRKMACHCGVAPFKQQSGKSIRGKSKVSHKANKKMKTLLNLSARSAVGSKGELQDFYLRKVAEGKNKMSALNAIRNKIIHRVFACVRDNRKYENFYTHALA